MRIKKPQTRHDLFKKVVMLYYKAEYENIRAFTFSKSDKYKQRQKLKQEVQELLQMWEDIRL